jgi:hypothetical protein
MEFITGRHLPRRTFLQGMGASVALPLLDAMLPAGRGWSTMKDEVDATRLVAIEMVHGAAGCNDWGATQNLWAPAEVGSDFDLSPTSLRSLEEWRQYLTVVSNTDVRMAEAFQPKEIGGDHFRSSAVFLTQAHPKQTEGSDVYVGTSLDQMFAQRFGQDTPIPSMQLCIENIDQSGGCAYGYTCVYTDSISWASPTEPLPVIRDPRVANELKRDLGPNDRDRLERYLDNVRELERRIELVEAQNRSGEVRELPEAPAGVPDSFEQHVQLMFDVQALAFESDVTRAFSFKMGRDSSARVFPESGTDKPFHPASHHGGNEEAILDFAKINTYHVSMLPYFLNSLSKIQEGESTLLDKTMIIYGSPMGDPNLHNHRRAPLIVLGGANGRLEGNLHLRAPDGTPMANAMLSMLHKLGMDDLEAFGDSTGEFALGGDGSLATAMGR